MTTSNSPIWLQTVLREYTTLFPNEIGALARLQKQMNENEIITSRKNMNGHITASSIILHDGKVLLIHHNGLQKMLAPGGHYEEENDQHAYETALREAEEETGIQGLTLHPWHIEHHFCPIYIESHGIMMPPRPDKNEGAHYHHDFVYIFTCENPETHLDINEVSNAQWVPLHDLQNEEYSPHLHIITRKILANLQ